MRVLKKNLDSFELGERITAMNVSDKRKSKAQIRVQTNLNLPVKTREQIEKASRKFYYTMTDVIVAAIDLYDREVTNKE